MVHFPAKYLIFAALFVTGFAVPVKRTVAQIEADIAIITQDVNNLNDAINSFPDSGGTLSEALVS
jgi:hypothetical protein